MMETPLTITTMMRRAVDLYGDREVTTMKADGGRHRYTYADSTIGFRNSLVRSTSSG